MDTVDMIMKTTVLKMLANGCSKADLLASCHAWGIEPYTQGAAKGDFLYWETLQKIAQYVLDYTRDEES
jgi:hypothetical protein